MTQICRADRLDTSLPGEGNSRGGPFEWTKELPDDYARCIERPVR